ncbi:MAG TPA: UDP-N-acetylmuramoyl-L-alanine--D-glutamate ligase [Acidimicrobiales bacterium]|jgi:UDP-N-acetylmuramoylalanine--D-glutamate ligase|nr:UDP-N-acetylmuramoyl-L-alanine--D-glutamate ligase [Acidimicrobiales bacterium]
MTDRALLLGLGLTNQAVADALVKRGHEVVVTDDRPTDVSRAAALARGIELVETPDRSTYDDLVQAASVVLPSPGIGDAHVALELARRHDVPVRSEFDLADSWNHRPVLAITGTDGKTTVTTLVTDMLRASGVQAVAAGNNELPLVTAIDDPTIDVFVVEASSFRLDHSEHFAPRVGTWLNFAPDHLNLHRSLDAYEQSKARLWRDQSPDAVAIGSMDDPIVLKHLLRARARQVTFGLGRGAEYHVEDSQLVDGAGTRLVAVDELWRTFPHDLSNALAAAATALAGGATVDGVHDALVSFRGLAHRIELVGSSDGVQWFDDSKATTPNATAAAIRSFPSVVLIAGGQNKGLDLSVLALEAPRIRAVVAIGEAAAEVEQSFAGVRPVVVARSMIDAVEQAAALARAGDAVLLSPACASFDWYKSYSERGDDFVARVRDLMGAR